MNRTDLQNLALERLDDARALLAARRWTGAHYMAGYALECALKACVFKVYVDSQIIFKEKKKMGNLNSGYWTHDLESLLKLAELTADFGQARQVNANLEAFWSTVKDWSVDDRYDRKSEQEARDLIDAISNNPDGVLTWLRTRW